MYNHLYDMKSFSNTFEKIRYLSEKYDSNYTAILFQVKKNSYIIDFQKFLLKHLRITDIVFSYTKTKTIVMLEETNIRWAIIFTERLREKIIEEWYNYDFFCSAIQWNFIDSHEKLIKSLNKRLKIAKECNNNLCVHSLSCID